MAIPLEELDELERAPHLTEDETAEWVKRPIAAGLPPIYAVAHVQIHNGFRTMETGLARLFFGD